MTTKIKATIITIAILVSTSASATETGFKIEKQVNGNWKEAFIVNYEPLQAYPRIFLNTEAVFLAPRADFTKPNHEYFGIEMGAKFQLPTSAILKLSTTAQFWWEGNSTGRPEGLEINEIGRAHV